MATCLAHKNMIDGLLKPSKVTDQGVLDAFSEVDRSRYMPPWAQCLAYCDAPFALKEGHPMMAPQVLGQLLQAMDLHFKQSILVVGCATGYTCALLRSLGLSVVGLESDEDLYNQALVLQETVEKRHCKFVRGSLSDGLLEWAPYDRILFDGAISYIPRAYRDQLKKGGILGAVYQPREKEGHICIFNKTKQDLEKSALGEVTQPYLKDFKAKDKFRFC